MSAGKAIVVDASKNITGYGNVELSGKLTTGTINLGGTDITSTASDINMLQGITKGTVSANKAVIVDGNNDISGFNDVSLAGRITTQNITLGGTAIDSTADEINTLNTVTGGQVSSEKAVIVDANNSISGFNNVGVSGTASLGNVAVSGTTNVNSLTSKTTGGSVLKLDSASTDIQVNDVLGKIEFSAPDESTGAVANMVGASIVAKSEGDFSSTNNSTKLSFLTGSGAAATEKVSIDSLGNVNITGGNLTVNGTQQITNDLTVDGNTNLLGDLTVTGKVVTTHATSLTVSDKLIKLGEGNTGTSQDLGLVFTRGDGAATNAANKSLIWQESSGSFVFAGTNTEDGETSGEVTIDSLSDVKMGKLSAVGDSTFGSNVTVDGSLTIGETTISSAEASFIDSVLPGTASASKALVVDANKDLTGVNNITITGELSAQTLDINGVDITAISEEINKLDGVTAGTVSGGKVVIADSESSVGGFKNIDLTGKLTASAINLGGDDITANAADINNLAGVTNGVVSAGKAVTVDGNNDVTGFNNITATGNVTTSSIILGGTSVTSSAIQINKLDQVVDGVVSGGKVVVAGSNNDISGFRDVSITRNASAANLDISGTTNVNSITSKSEDGSVLKLQSSSTNMQINDILGKIEFQSPDEATGDVATMVGASIVAKSEGDFSSTSNPTTLAFMTGGTAAASEKMSIDSSGNVIVTSGDLTVNGSQQVTNNLNVGGNLVLGSTTLNADSLAVLEGITLGETTNGKVITQGNTGVTKIGTTNGPEILDIASHNTTSSGLKLAGDLVTSNAAELNVLHNVTSGTVSGSSAVVVDQNKDINGFNNITATGNLTTSSITLGGTAISSSAQDINKIESVVDGTVSANKAVVAGTDSSVTGFSNIELTGKLTTGQLKL